MADTALRVLLVDDEPLGIERLQELLQNEPGTEIVGIAEDGVDALHEIRRLMPDVVFLDVDMPRLSGTDVVRELRRASAPVTIFVTAHSQFALEAFDLAAVDYLVKPFTDARFSEALQRARRGVELTRIDDLRSRLLAALTPSDSGNATRPAEEDEVAPSRVMGAAFRKWIPVQKRGRTRVVRVADIEYITASDQYVLLHLGQERHLIRESMQRLEEQLDPREFCRIHRSVIVRLDQIDTVMHAAGGDYAVRLKCGAELAISRPRRELLRRRLGLSA